jgi:ABC-2 type transport system ATP-binding protein
MIEVRALHHRYGPLVAVRQLSFSVQKGEVLGLLGPNGAGKSTAMRAVVGLLTPTRGSVHIGGHDLATDSRSARALLGYLPEHNPLDRELRVEEFLSFAARAKGVPAARIRSEVDRVVGVCGLETVRRRLIGFCSRGYRQRTGLAQALVGDPPALVLDEPTVGLDPTQIVGIRDSIAELAHDKAVILSTHVLSEASRLCTRVLILDRGECRAEGSPDELSRALSRTPHLRVVARPPERALSVLRSIDGVEVEYVAEGSLRVSTGEGISTAEIVRALVRGDCEIDEVGPERLGLEEVFLRLVGSSGAEGSSA